MAGVSDVAPMAAAGAASRAAALRAPTTETATPRSRRDMGLLCRVRERVPDHPTDVAWPQGYPQMYAA
ncbi:hypothetical protein GCM10010489_12850 [Microbacterium saperdae]|nr:hypothetical protein GCM10010489_12850 [Microbacterium saperdae]